MSTIDHAKMKHYGRTVKEFRAEEWDRVKYDVVVRGNLAKFTQNEELKAYLLGTGDAILVEASPYDSIWGIGMSSRDPDVFEPARWKGENLLGKALMQVRLEVGKTTEVEALKEKFSRAWHQVRRDVSSKDMVAWLEGQKAKKAVSDFAVPRGTVLEVDDDSYTVDDCVPSVGGFGSVYRISRAGDGEPFAAKFMLDADVKGQSRKLAAEIKRKTLQRFDNEIARLKEMEVFGEDRPFPHCLGRGVWQGHPFYVMELLEKVNLYEIQTEEERRRFVSALCDAVSFLHGRGYVHYDIKPSNILKRWSVSYGRACVTYVLADFGSVHKVEQHQRTDQGEALIASTVSRLSDGRRMRVGTPGYADPVDDLHTVHADIYAIGQVIRDMFQESVPILWATIINKCTSRNYNYRYQTPAEISRGLADIVFQGPKMWLYSKVSGKPTLKRIGIGDPS